MSSTVTLDLTSPEQQAAGLTVTREGVVVTVVLDRAGSRNSQTPALWRALAQVGRDLESDVRAVVLLGDGPSFSAGLDRAMFSLEGIPGEPSLPAIAAMPRDELDALIATYQDAFTWWRECDAVTVAGVQGHAVGAGFQLALACDLVVVDPTAAFCMKEPALGLVPDLGGTSPLVAAVGYPRALEICASGRWVHAEEALALGLAVATAAPGHLHEAIDALLAPILANPAGSVTATKHLLRDAPGRTPQQQRDAERAAQAGRLAALLGG